MTKEELKKRIDFVVNVFFKTAFLYFIAFVISSCSTSFTLSHDFEPNKVKKLNYVDPFCAVVHHDSIVAKQDTASLNIYKTVNTIINSNKRAYRFNDKIEISDSTLRIDFYKDVLQLAADIDLEYKMRDKKISQNIQRVLNSQQENELAVVIYNRIVPSKKEVRKNVANNVLVVASVGIVTGALFGYSFIPISNQKGSLQKGGFYLLIFDKSHQRTSYYKKVVFVKNDYKSKVKLKERMDILFKMFIHPE